MPTSSRPRSLPKVRRSSPPAAPAPLPPPPVDALGVLGPVARSSVVDAVAERIRGEILAGRLSPGNRLPSERELSLALGVNRLTLRASLARLEAMGLVTTRHGAGTVVAHWRERAGLEALATLAGSVPVTDPAWRDLVVSMLELRRVLAAEAVALAAERHTPADLDTLEARAAEQRGRIHDPVAFARGELAFERALARTARNVGMELVLNSFAKVPDEHPELVALLYDRPDQSLAFYPFVLGLVRAGDGARARAAVREALDRVDEDWIRRHLGPPAFPPRPPTTKKRRAPRAS